MGGLSLLIMSNTRKIQSFTTWTPEGEKSITIMSLNNFHDYHFDNGGGKVEYKIGRAHV